MTQAYISEGVRTPIGRYGGSLSGVRTDDLAAEPMKALKERCKGVDWERLDDVYYGCANQSGEDNRNVARMGLLLAGLPSSVPGATVNRLCASGLEAVATAARSVKSGDGDLMLAGGVESMTRAPYVMGKASGGFDRGMRLEDTTIGWRFVNEKMKEVYGVDSMPVTGENVAQQYQVSREDQDRFALWSQKKASAARERGRFRKEIEGVEVKAGRRGETRLVDEDEHLRPETTLEGLSKLPTPFLEGGTVTAGNASGVNDGAAAMFVGNEGALKEHGLEGRARVLSGASHGVEPRVMGIGPAGAAEKALGRAGLTMKDMDVVELNEAFASQALATMRLLGMSDDDERVNPNGGAIALGHPLGMSGARLALTATQELQESGGKYALCMLCVGVGQGAALILERVLFRGL